MIYKDIKGYEGLYQISDTGKVKSLNFGKSKILKPLIKIGYEYASLYKNKKCKHYRIHRLVAFAFIHNADNKPTVNHKNGIRNDNRLENLEWMTWQENVQHGWDVNGRKMTDKAIGCKVVYQYDLEGNFIRTYKSVKIAATKMNISESTISQVCRNEKKKSKGFIWKYND